MKSQKSSETNRDVKSNGLLEDALKLTSAPIITQFLGFFIAPFVTHMYSPEAFGTLAAYNSVISPFGAIVALSYPAALVLAKSDSEKNNILALCLLSTVTFSLLSFLVVFLGGEFIASLMNLPILVSYFWMVPLNVFLWGTMLTFRYWNVKETKYYNIAFSGISEVITNNGFILSIGYLLKPLTSTLIYGKFIGGFVRTLILVRHFTISKIIDITYSVSYKKILLVAKKHKQFLLLGTPNTLILRVIDEIPTYLILYFFSSSILGFYALGVRVLSAPMSLIGSSISEVYYQREGQNDVINALSFEKIFSFLFIVSIMPFIILGTNGEQLFCFVFGEKWATAGIYAQILSFNLFVLFISSLVGPIAAITNKQHVSLYFSLLNAFVLVIAIFIGGILKNDLIMVILISVFSGICYSLYALKIYHTTNWSFKNVFSNIKPYLFLSLLFSALIIILKYYFQLTKFLVLIDIGILGIYFFYVMKTQNEFRLLIAKLSGNKKFK